MLSNRSPRRIARSLAGMLAVLTVAAPIATASPIDPALHLRGHGAGQAALQTQTYVAHPLVDRQETSPRAFASTYVSHPLADRQATHGPVVVSATADDGFDWGSAGIGGGVAVAAVALCAGLALAPRRHSAHPAA
jgi:hypothetical protein